MQLSLVLACALLLRTLAPSVWLPEKEGYVALCTGSAIVYIPVPGQEPNAPIAYETESCPWLSHFHLIEPLSPPVIVGAVFHGPVSGPRVVRPVPDARRPAPFQARAPPMGWSDHIAVSEPYPPIG